MANRRTIAVVGATGAQGGGLVRAIIEDGAFTARAITRNPDAPRARELAAAGAEVVAADLDDVASLERAFDGAYGAFCLTNFWEHFSPERELSQATNQATAAKSTGVQHVIWSTLEDTRRFMSLEDDRMPTLMGKYKVPHFDAKGEADAVFRGLGVPTTYLLTSFYWENMIHFGLGPKRGVDGELALTLPLGKARLPGIGVEDIGRCALGVLQRGQELVGRHVAIAGDRLTGDEMAAALSRALAQPVRYNAVSPSVFRSFGFPGADDLGNMFQFKVDFEDAFAGARDPSIARSLNPRLQSFELWLTTNAERIPLD